MRGRRICIATNHTPLGLTHTITPLRFIISITNALAHPPRSFTDPLTHTPREKLRDCISATGTVPDNWFLLSRIT